MCEIAQNVKFIKNICDSPTNCENPEYNIFACFKTMEFHKIYPTIFITDISKRLGKVHSVFT